MKKKQKELAALFLLVITFLVFISPLSAAAIDSDKCVHDFEVETVEPTADNDGEKIYSCKLCGYSFSQILLATGHSYGEWIVDKQPSCNEAGSRHRVCTRHANDPHVESEAIAALGHKFKETTTPPNCESDGVTTKTCERCGETHSEVTAPATGHKHSESVVKQATVESDGEKKFTCEHCGDTYFQAIPHLPQADEKPITKAEIVEKKETQTQQSNSTAVFPNTLDILLILVAGALAIAFGRSVGSDVRLLKWQKGKSVAYRDWLSANR